MDFSVIIPARYNSERLPGKPLLKLANKTLLEHVYERAVESGAQQVVVATDDEPVAKVAKDVGAIVCMTSSKHESGTDRIAEAVDLLGFEKNDIVIGLQVSQPLVPSALITDLAQNLHAHDNTKVGTVATREMDPKVLFDPDTVKVVLNYRGFAMYFSRAPIPWNRGCFSDCMADKKIDASCLPEGVPYYRHLGLYAYRAGFLETYTNWDPSPIEKVELLEPLRILWHGTKMHVSVTELDVPLAVNTQADLKQVSVLV